MYSNLKSLNKSLKIISNENLLKLYFRISYNFESFLLILSIFFIRSLMKPVQGKEEETMSALFGREAERVDYFKGKKKDLDELVT